jgi:hypothetical protein
MNRRNFMKWMVLASGAVHAQPVLSLAEASVPVPKGEGVDTWSLEEFLDNQIVCDENGFPAAVVSGWSTWVLTRISRKAKEIGVSDYGQLFSNEDLIGYERLPKSILSHLPNRSWYSQPAYYFRVFDELDGSSAVFTRQSYHSVTIVSPNMSPPWKVL